MDTKKKLYIHIGWPKTGTSAIQKFLVDNYKTLKDKYSLFYPDYGRWGDGSHHNIAFSLRENPYCKIKTEKEQIVYLNKLKDLISQSNCENIILSSECFNLYDSDSFKDLFCDEFDIKIICYLRIQDEYLESIYGQNVRDPHFKEQRTFRNYIEYFKDRLFYYSILNKWEAITSPENFVIRFYNKECFLNNNIVDDFLNIFSITNDKSIFKSSSTNVNISYGKSVLEYKRLLNIIMEKQDGDLISLLQKYSQLNSEEKHNFLTSEEKNSLNFIFKEDNLLIQKRYINCNFNPDLIYEASEKDKVFETLTTNSLESMTQYIYDNNKIIFNNVLDSFGTYPNTLTDDLERIFQSFSKISSINNQNPFYMKKRIGFYSLIKKIVKDFLK